MNESFKKQKAVWKKELQLRESTEQWESSFSNREMEGGKRMVGEGVPENMRVTLELK